jgi:hypothetical protein
MRHPLPDWNLGDDAGDPLGGALGPTPASARGEEAGGAAAAMVTEPASGEIPLAERDMVFWPEDPAQRGRLRWTTGEA